MLDLNSVVKNAHSSLSEEKRKEVVRFLENYGARDEKDLKQVTVEELMENNLLQKAAAKRLFNYFQTGRSSETHEQPAAPSPSQSGKFIQNTHGNAGRVIAAGGDYNETYNNADTINKFDNVRDVQTGGTSYKTNFEKEVNSDVLVTGQGNVYKK